MKKTAKKKTTKKVTAKSKAKSVQMMGDELAFRLLDMALKSGTKKQVLNQLNIVNRAAVVVLAHEVYNFKKQNGTLPELTLSKINAEVLDLLNEMESGNEMDFKIWPT